MLNWQKFQRPQRYLGNEWNVVQKRIGDGTLRICLCYPDLYEIGMSNLGLRMIYSLLNEFEGVVCERVFMPAEDMYEFLTKSNTPLFSLETKTPLYKFDVMGFNLSYELNYANLLHILYLGRIPLRCKERKRVIVLGGGIVNPHPLSEFVDVFFLGEFEGKARKLVEILKKFKDKESRLSALCEIDGFYVPKFYNNYLKNGRYYFEKKYPYAKFPLKRVYVKNLNTSYYPFNWLTPYTKIVHDRAQVEIARGCPNRCYFCQARCFYYPYRERSVSRVLELVEKIYKSSGYENFSLMALSASDYSHIKLLVEKMVEMFGKKRVGISLPSLRINDIVGGLYKELRKLKKVSLTLALEAATPALREKINKKIDVDILFKARDIIKLLDVRHIKLYFMFGLPEEKEEDVKEIVSLVRRLKKTLKVRINLSINAFVPKPLSYFSNLPMEKEETLIKKKEIISQGLLKEKIGSVSFSFIKRSMLEAILSRADETLSKVIYRAFLLGATELSTMAQGKM
ncbi:MAG: hypothetical protein B6D56_05180 [Candidatus Omnitrophica bacterium 4484_70.1]|nr:MAG: hypothetical protein B6D56_05180 [Candidatus Omnitrophica bacterium 4484_70.1]